MARRGDLRWLAVWLAAVVACALATPAYAQADPDKAAAEDDDDDDDDDDDGDDDDDDDDGDDDDDSDEAPPAPKPAAPAEAPAEPATDKAPTEPDEEKKREYGKGTGLDWLAISGYGRAGFRFAHRPDALPADRNDFGFSGAVSVEVEAQPFEMWHALVNVEFNDQALRVLQSDGTGGTESTRIAGTIIQEATMRFVPAEWFRIRAGMVRIPFTLSSQLNNNRTMFPSRSNSNELFLSGSDVGAMAEGNFGDGIFTPSIGVFNGDSLGLRIANARETGVVVSFRADVNPFGKFDRGTSDPLRGKFRLGLGGGLLIRPLTAFDKSTLTEPRDVLDVRFSASLRMAVRGLFFSAEYLRRQQTDNFTFRPEVADSANAQLAFFFTTIDSLALEPLARVGFTAADQTFDPRLTGFTDAGINIYPAADGEEPDDVRLTLQYHGERRFTEVEDAHEGRVSALVQF